MSTDVLTIYLNWDIRDKRRFYGRTRWEAIKGLIAWVEEWVVAARKLGTPEEEVILPCILTGKGAQGLAWIDLQPNNTKPGGSIYKTDQDEVEELYRCQLDEELAAVFSSYAITAGEWEELDVDIEDVPKWMRKGLNYFPIEKPERPEIEPMSLENSPYPQGKMWDAIQQGHIWDSHHYDIVKGDAFNWELTADSEEEIRRVVVKLRGGTAYHILASFRKGAATAERYLAIEPRSMIAGQGLVATAALEELLNKLVAKKYTGHKLDQLGDSGQAGATIGILADAKRSFRDDLAAVKENYHAMTLEITDLFMATLAK